ncbi:zinc-binding dehydrogenase [Streptomyces sp. NPDC059740]|uniref:zinc-dependent alcohol dehydrogenase n=1 Tax=Streptomyces sp. NPDC059740 TaxID=3346926 RepID=UPI0036478748
MSAHAPARDTAGRPTQRAVVVDGPGRHRVARVPVPEPGPGQVRVDVAAAGVCGSDREVHDGTRPAGYVRYPLTPGHEWAGTVAAVGGGVDPGLVGRPVVAEGFVNCQVCARCRSGETSLCEAEYDETGFTRPGAFAQSLVVPARLVHTLPEGADLRAAALLEPAAVAAAAALAARPVPGERIAVVGAGALGLLTVQLLAAASPAELVAVDPRTARADAAQDMGATSACGPRQAAPGRFDLVVETAGAPDSAATAVRLARRGGRVVLVGLPVEGARGLDPIALTLGQISVHGVFGASSGAWTHAVRAFAQGLLRPGPLVTHSFPLERYAEAVALVGSGDPGVGKVLLLPGEE